MGEQSKETVVTDEQDTVEQIDLEHKETDHSNEAESDHVDNNTEAEVELELLHQKLDSLEKEKDSVNDRLLRLQAEYENFKKRSEREKAAERKYKSQDLADALLPAIDNFERALKIEVNDDNRNLFEGITMVYNQLQEAFKAQGIEKIKTVDEPFDPNLHHAVMQVEEEGKESNTIVEELQAGYILNDRVIRPAMVKVNK
ncbi:nucleotide exchange factor GrpE [Virgibacillus sp. W0430]|uniref:nucleotide exchange factor GrpE n=1 Tax=Virgibacillus sp. W0430 TaxID=3391580 RepID=UPI003F46CACB